MYCIGLAKTQGAFLPTQGVIKTFDIEAGTIHVRLLTGTSFQDCQEYLGTSSWQ